MYRGQTLVWKLSFAFVPWQQKHYRRFDLSFLSPDSALSVKPLSSEEQLCSVGLSFRLLPSPVTSPGEGANGRNPAKLLFLGIRFSMSGFLVLSPQLRCSACLQTLPEALGGAGAKPQSPEWWSPVPWGSPGPHRTSESDFQETSRVRESWMVRIHRSFS